MEARRASRWAGVCLLVLAAAGCSDRHPGPVVTGLGATMPVWTAHHGAGYSAVVTNSAGRVRGYILTTSPQSLADFTTRVKRDLPADATASAPAPAVGIEETKCEIVAFTSPTLQRVLGGDHGGDVTAVFEAENAIVMDTHRIVSATVVSGSQNPAGQC